MKVKRRFLDSILKTATEHTSPLPWVRDEGAKTLGEPVETVKQVGN
ncbi:MAG: hypothetical protein ABJM43_18380 [Paracoccaceae bacterium]